MNKIKNADLPAHPLVMESGHPYHASQVCFDNSPLTSGLSKREAFAMAAMQGLLSSDTGGMTTHDEITERSIQLADGLLRKLDR